MAEAPTTRPSLLVRIRDRRDRQAWAQFVDLYGPLVYGFGRRQGLQDADAVDLMQDVLRTVAGAVGPLDYDPRRGTFRGWLFTVARNRLRDSMPDLQLRPAPGVQGLAGWNHLWGAPDGESRDGRPRYQGGDLLAQSSYGPQRLTPADFRLRPGSPGKGTGAGGRDLGADVDLVGPGAPYERWKKTPDYPRWLKATGQAGAGN